MSKTLGHILKSNDVKLEGQFHLNLEQVESARGGANSQVRIVENHPEFAVIEITCSCGTKTRLKCEYGGGEPTAEEPQTKNGPSRTDSHPPNQANGAPVPDQVSNQTE